jgi:hypothetical protein
MVRTYWLVPVFYEASGVLDLQPVRTTTKSKPVVPVLCATNSTSGQLSPITGSPFPLRPLAVRVQVPPRGVPPLYAWRTQLRSASWPQ